MKQLGLDLNSGAVTLLSVPTPQLPAHGVLVRTAYSVISSGTERTKVELASKSLLDKARSRPDQVAKVLDGIRNDGLVATVRKVQDRLAVPQPLGYSLAGVVEAVGAGCDEFRVGDRVACGGASASHAEFVAVSTNLVVPVPSAVPLREAAFATVGAIAMHGVRTGGTSLGDRVLVIGLGLIGQIAARLCVAAGAHVFGVDPRGDRCALARSHGASQTESLLDGPTAQQVVEWSGGRGADVVLITAGGADNRPLQLAGAAARDRARVVVVGAVGLDVPREPFYHKELTLVVSRSYGPGRYDPDFEEKGMAYPVGFVPWTERRNMEEILSLLASGQLSLEGIGDLAMRFGDAAAGYEALGGSDGASPIAVVLEYPGPPEAEPSSVIARPRAARPELPAVVSFAPRALNISFLGMGNFATSTLLGPVREMTGVTLQDVVTASPIKAEAARSRSGFRRALTNGTEAVEASETSIVMIATRHDSHARYAKQAVRAGKAVFVEKPLALNNVDLDSVERALETTGARLMVGFNRRFAPATEWVLRRLGSNRDGLRFLARINAGPLPHDHWILDPDSGGGRLIGEGCHFLDLATFVASAPPVEVLAVSLDRPGSGRAAQSFHVEVRYENDATASIEYVAQGDPALAKERFEVHRSGTSCVIDDFRAAECYRAGKRTAKRWPVRDKGHRAEVIAFLEAVQVGGPTPIPEVQSIESSRLTLAAARSIREGRALTRDEW